MSKIGKINISIPEKVKAVLSGNVLNIEGPLGKKSLNIDLEMFKVDIVEGKTISKKSPSPLLGSLRKYALVYLFCALNPHTWNARRLHHIFAYVKISEYYVVFV